jgi:hypothetical protein
LGGGVIPVLRRAANRQNGLTSNTESCLANCATGAEREGNSTIRHQRLEQFLQRPSPF